MGFAMFEMVKQPLIQDRLREDIRKALKTTKGAVTYKLVMHELPYLNQIINETLRMYPVLALFDRMCEMTDGSDGYSLEPYGDFKIPNGTPVMFPAYAMSYDEKFFNNPKLFDPERFAPENKDNIVGGSYFPFGLGPHVCIGERFAMMQVKVSDCCR
jgi:cytochrome P450 family 6